MATYPPMSNDRRVSYSSEANTSGMMHTGFSSNPAREESPLHFGGRSQFLMHSMTENSNAFEPPHQGLSLSLGATRAVNVINPIVRFHNEPSILGCNNIASGEDKDTVVVVGGAGGNNCTSYTGRIDVDSKYLRAAQDLLEEVVSVKKDSIYNTKSVGTIGSKENNECESTDANLRDLSSGEKQEMQDKLTKLLWMLAEVDRRYKQYYHQMHVVVSSFDAISGSGAAKPYTSLALQTISRHFRSLRDAINGQIGRARKSLGGEDCSACSNDRGGIGISRLKYVDRQIRQQRALQHLGMMQPHAWRPQRGLPEASVTVLRAWLFEHFLHPYPKDSDKVMLARQTGLSRSQVSNWFINARVRLWKPMIEDMYREEEQEANVIGGRDADVDSTSSTDNIVPSGVTAATAATTTTDHSKSITREDHHRIPQQDTAPPPSSSAAMRRDTKATIIDESENFDHPGGPSNRGYYTEQQNEPVGIFPGGILHSTNDVRRTFFGGYDVPHQMERFGNNVGGISLTLGLQREFEGGGGIGVDMVTEGFVPARGNGVDSGAYDPSGFGYGGSLR